MKIKAKIEIEFEFDVASATNMADVQRQAKLFLQTHLHQTAEHRLHIKRCDVVEVVKKIIGHTTYYVYHADGYYKDADGKYDAVGNFGIHPLQWCIDHMNRCRNSCGHKRPPLKILKVKMWQTGRSYWVNVF